MNVYTIEDYRAAANRALAAGNLQAAEELAQAGIALQANPAGTGVSRAVQRGAYQTAAAPAQMLATADITAMSDKARLATPEGQSGIAYEELRAAGVPAGAFASRAADTGDPVQNVAMMQQAGVSPSAQASFGQIVGKRIENAENVNVDEASQRAATNLGFAGEMHDRAAALPRSPKAEEYAQIFDEAPDSFKGFLGTITDEPIGFMAWAGETLAESGPAIGAGIATSALTGNPALGAGVMSTGGFSREYSNEVSKFLGEKGIDLSDPNAVRALLNNPQAMAEANARGVTRGLVIAMFEAAGQGAVASKLFGKTIAHRTGSQMLTEGGGEAAATGAVGDDISIKESLAEGVVGAGSVIPEGMVAGQSLFNRDGTIVDPQTLDNRSKQAAGTLANRLQRIAVEGNENGKPYNLNDIKPMSDNGARAAVDAAHVQIAEEVKDKEIDLSELIKPKDGDSADIRAKKVSAKVALRMTKNKTKSVVTKGDYDALADLVGHTKQGQELLNLIAESQAATSVHNSGYKGGLSRFTDQFAPWGSTTGYSPTAAMTESAVRPLVSLATGTATGGISFASQLGAMGAGRAIDAVTRRRSKVARFVRKNAGKFGLPEPTGLDIEKEKSLTEEQAREQRLAIGRVATALNAAKPGPLQNIMLGTGLDRQGLIDVVKKMATDFKNETEFTDVLGQIENNLKGEGNRIDALTEVIPVLGAYAQQNAPELIKYMPDNPGLAREWTGETQQPQRSPNYESGKADNQTILAGLRRSLAEDKSVLPNDKGVLLTALADLEANLGIEPVRRVNEIVDKVKSAKVPQKHIDKYIMPYVDRVIQQQT